MRKLLCLYCFMFLGCFHLISQTENIKNTQQKDGAIDKKVKDLLSQMTLEEKIGQMNQYNGFMDFTGPTPKQGDAKKKLDHIKNGLVGAMLNVRGVKNVKEVQRLAVEESRLGIPLLFGFDVIHGYKTTFPIPLAEASSFDLDLMRRTARVAAIEASAAGINWTFAPMIDISRDARWGRVMEGSGEDPYYGSLVAEARVNGFQGDDLTNDDTILACAKHFAGYGFALAGRDYNTVSVGNDELYNTIFPPFMTASKAGVRTFMNSFNDLNGIPATGNSFLQRDILKDKWKFEGFIVSDWGSISEMIAHGYAKDLNHAAELAANAGSDMDMESYAYINHLKSLVKNGKVDEKYINDAAGRILKTKFELGLFDDPYKYCDTKREKELLHHPDHHNLALEAALKSIILLKNEKSLLPLSKKNKRIAVIGPLATDKDSPLGSWRIASDDDSAVSLAEGLKQYDSNDYTFVKGVDVVLDKPVFYTETKVNTTNRKGIEEALKVAKENDIVIMVLGEYGFMSGEGRSRADLGLPGLQQELLEAVYAVNKNIVLVLNNGRPLILDWADKHIPAIIEAWQLGSEAGHAISKVLFGDYNPSGKLPMSFPRHIGQLPMAYNHKSTGRPTANNKDSVFWSHYTDMDNSPLYPFGYGLSYTSFEYNSINLNNTFSENGIITFDVKIKNTGKIEGTEVAQLYIHDRYASIVRPVKELKGFKRVTLKPGESKKVTFALTESELGFYNNDGTYLIEPGVFDIYVGGSSTANLKSSFTLE